MVRVQEPQVLSMISVFQAISPPWKYSVYCQKGKVPAHQLLEQWCLAQACGQSCSRHALWAHLMSVRSFAKSKVQIYVCPLFPPLSPSLVLCS